MKKENFELLKIKIADNGGLDVDYKEKFTDGDSAYSEKNMKESPRIPHPDMTEALNALKNCLAKSNDLLVHRKEELIAPNNRSHLETKEIQRILNQWDKAVFDSMEVTGVSFQGDLETGSCVITGKHKVHNTKMAMNSPKINFNSTAFGIESEVANLLEVVIEEAYLYIFEKKGSQAEMDFSTKEEEAVEA